MYRVVLWRFHQRYVEDCDTISEAHRTFNYVGEHGMGFAESILDSNNIILRDSMKNIIGRRENRKGKHYDLTTGEVK